jgi:hypothetical protein
MPIYCKARPDEDVFKELGNAKSVFMIGCPNCANVCYSIDKNMPLRKITAKGIQAVCTYDEIQRLSILFIRKGIDIQSWIPSYPISLCSGIDDRALKSIAMKSKRLHV